MDLLRYPEGSETVYRLGWTLLHALWTGGAVGLLLAAALPGVLEAILKASAP